MILGILNRNIWNVKQTTPAWDGSDPACPEDNLGHARFLNELYAVAPAGSGPRPGSKPPRAPAFS